MLYWPEFASTFILLGHLDGNLVDSRVPNLEIDPDCSETRPRDQMGFPKAVLLVVTAEGGEEGHQHEEASTKPHHVTAGVHFNAARCRR